MHHLWLTQACVLCPDVSQYSRNAMCHITSRVTLSPMSSVAQDQGYLGTHRNLEIMSPHALIHKTDPGREHWALELSTKFREFFTIFGEETFIIRPLHTASQTEMGTLQMQTSPYRAFSKYYGKLSQNLMDSSTDHRHTPTTRQQNIQIIFDAN